MRSGNAALDEAIASSVTADYMDPINDPPQDRWPVLVRLAVIIGLSMLLWSGIIWGVMALLG